jgi:CRP-like cAMP-binding protein
MYLPTERLMTQKQKPDFKALLTGQPLFNDLSNEEITRVTQNVRELRPKKGEILFNKGDECKGLHILLTGLVKLSFISPHGHEKVVEIIHPGQMFGEALMFLERPYVVSSQALADSWVLYFPKATIFEELERDPRLAHKMIAGLSVRLHQLISNIEDYSLHSGKKRVIGYLLREIADVSPPIENHACTIHLSISKNIIASLLSMTQEHFSRILHELAELGLIAVRSREIHIPDIRRLQQYEDED